MITCGTYTTEKNQRTLEEPSQGHLRHSDLCGMIVSQATKPMISNELLNQLQELTRSANLTPAVESAIHNLMESAREEGYSDGFDEGRYEESYMNSMSYLGD